MQSGSLISEKASGNSARSLHGKCTGSVKFSGDFLPESVTAKTISRLSQGVARLTADDSALNDSKYAFRRSNSTADYHTLPSYSNSCGKSRRSISCKYSTYIGDDSSSSVQTCENGPKWANKNQFSSHIDKDFPNGAISNAPSASNDTHSPTLNSVSPSFQLFNSVKNVPQTIPFGSKRTFRQVTDSLLGDRFSSLSNIHTKHKVLHAETTLGVPKFEIAPVRRHLVIRSRFPRKSNISSTNEYISKTSNYCDIKDKDDINSTLLPTSSLFSKISHSRTRRYSSDASMLSITPSHSSSSVSSSPVLSSSSDSEIKSHHVKGSRAKNVSLEISASHRSRLKSSGNFVSDSWHWRSTNTVTVRESSLHPRNHRPHIASSNGDDSSDGPTCRLKKARINFVITSPDKSIESALESEQSERETLEESASKLSFSRRSQHQRKCNCSPSSLRRSNSLSPTRCTTGRRQRPMRFRLSCLRSFESDEMTTSYAVEATHTSCSIALSTRCKSRCRTCQDEDEGDDECSDASPDKLVVINSLE